MNTPADDTAIWNALSSILDPEFGLSIVDLGLVYSASVSDGVVQVAMTLTTPSCPASNYIVEGARASLAALSGIREAHVNLVWNPPWTPAFLSESARESLGWEPVR
jgi:metal-sulfur cluster biosynthetic enzyme